MLFTTKEIYIKKTHIVYLPIIPKENLNLKSKKSKLTIKKPKIIVENIWVKCEIRFLYFFI